VRKLASKDGWEAAGGINMASWKLNELGLLVPDGPYTSGPPVGLKGLRKVLGKKYLLAKPKRDKTAGPTKPPANLKFDSLDFRNIEPHVRGRGEESVRVLVGVAFLRSKGLIGRDAVVSYSGARYQRGKGNESFVAAHQFPCTPTINSFPLPTFAPHGRLRAALAHPLAITDYLPKLFNYADGLFESAGGCEAVIEPIRLIMHDQKQGQPVYDKLVQHAALSKLLPSYIEAYQTAHEAASADQIGIDLLDPAAIDRLTESALSTTADLDTSRPTQQMAMVADVLWHSINVARSNTHPAAATTNEITRYATELASYTPAHG
jgi:hypothetical protein